MAACDTDNVKTVEMVLKAGKTNIENNLMISAVNKQSPLMLETLVIQGADINEVILLDAYSYTTSLHYAVDVEDIVMIKKIIDLGGDVNNVDSNWRTPLHLACLFGYYRVVNLLIENVELS